MGQPGTDLSPFSRGRPPATRCAGIWARRSQAQPPCFRKARGSPAPASLGSPPDAQVTGVVHNPDSTPNRNARSGSAWLNAPAAPPLPRNRPTVSAGCPEAYSAKRLDDALEMLGEAVKLRSNFVSPISAAAILREQARFAQASAHLMEAKRLHPLNKGPGAAHGTLFFAGQCKVAATRPTMRCINRDDATYQLLAAGVRQVRAHGTQCGAFAQCGESGSRVVEDALPAGHGLGAHERSKQAVGHFRMPCATL